MFGNKKGNVVDSRQGELAAFLVELLYVQKVHASSLLLPPSFVFAVRAAAAGADDGCCFLCSVGGRSWWCRMTGRTARRASCTTFCTARRTCEGHHSSRSVRLVTPSNVGGALNEPLSVRPHFGIPSRERGHMFW